MPSTRGVAGAGALSAISFWAALTLLALNDHVLKGAGVCPSWLTGKLSDFAGLIVAPAVAAELCRGRAAPLRLWAAGAVVVVFVATELSITCAAAVVSAFGSFGIGIKLWPDPTDLAALVVLPWTWRLIGRPRADRPTPWSQRLGLAVAALACVATSPPPRIWRGPFLVNHSGGKLVVEVTWFEGPDACTRPLDQVARALDGLPVAGQHDFELSHERTMRLDLPTDDPEEVVGVCPKEFERGVPDGGAAPCVLIRLAGPELPPHLIRSSVGWVASKSSQCAWRVPVYEDPAEGALVIGHGEDGERSVTAFHKIEKLRLE